jgi:hypothetical protein
MRFVIYQDNGGQFHWSLVDEDRVSLAVSATRIQLAGGRASGREPRASARRLGHPHQALIDVGRSPLVRASPCVGGDGRRCRRSGFPRGRPLLI